MSSTLRIFPLKTQQAPTGRLQIDPDQCLYPACPDI
jgi:hypothetical protein